jgi:hypothetical protein
MQKEDAKWNALCYKEAPTLAPEKLQAAGGQKDSAEKGDLKKRTQAAHARRRAGEHRTVEQMSTETSRCCEPRMQTRRLHLRSPDLLFT